MRDNMLRRLPLEEATGHYEAGGRHRLRVIYKTRHLVLLGLGVTIGAGIFNVSGVQARTTAGPAVIMSLLLAGVVCLLAALAYAELSSVMPVAGSAYSFSYVIFGELCGWLVGWALLMELMLASSVLARVWSSFAVQTLGDFEVSVPSPLVDGLPVPDVIADLVGRDRLFDVFALLILLLLVLLLATGARLSLSAMWFMVLAKLIVIGLIIAGGMKFFDIDNLRPFVPQARPAADSGSLLDALLPGAPETFGVWGVFAAAPAIAFAYIGFDLIATAAEETEDAPRKVPIGMLTTLVTAIFLYLGVAVALLGMTSYKNLTPGKPPLAVAFAEVGAGSMGKVVDVGALLGLTTVLLVLLISATRVIFSMARDGLLPPGLASVSRRYRVPTRATLLAGAVAIVTSQLFDLARLEQLVVIGTLFTFLFVTIGVIALRRSRPDLHREFRVPLVPLTPLLGTLAIGWLMLNLKLETWAYFMIWMLGGLLLYFAYGRRRSRLRGLLQHTRPAEAAAMPPPYAPLPLAAPTPLPPAMPPGPPASPFPRGAPGGGQYQGGQYLGGPGGLPPGERYLIGWPADGPLAPASQTGGPQPPHSGGPGTPGTWAGPRAPGGWGDDEGPGAASPPVWPPARPDLFWPPEEDDPPAHPGRHRR